jgi:4-carboxymuconolactone decarboxylase
MSTPADSRRFPLIPEEKLTPEQRAIVDDIRAGPRSKLTTSSASKPGPIGGPFNVMLRSPGIGMLIQKLGGEIRFSSVISGKLNELAILVTARHHTANYEWNAHCRLALQGGLDPAIAQAIAEGRRPEGMDTDETLVYEFSRELHQNHRVSDAMFKRAVERFGERGVVDIIAVNGYYTLVSFLLNVDQTPLPDGVTPALKPLLL